MYQVVLCNCPSVTVAQDLAQRLVKEQLAACVNVIPQVFSIYSWQDKIECEPEVMMFIKTTHNNFSALSALIKQHHPYDVPEVIALNIQQGDSEYLNWITGTIK